MGDVSPPDRFLNLPHLTRRQSPGPSPLGLASVRDLEIQSPSSDSHPLIRPIPHPEPSSDNESNHYTSVSPLIATKDYAQTGVFPPSPPMKSPKTVLFTPSFAMEASDPRKPEKGATIVWRDLTVSIGGKRGGESSKLLKSATGFARPGSLLAIMGSACSGKNTLLKALADQLPRNAKVYGDITLNGRRRQLHYGTYAYIRTEEEWMEALTVREMLHYSALLQLPSSLPLSKKLARVDASISAMDLEDLVDVRIGCAHRNGGLSRVERKLLSLAIQLISRPYLLFLEDPTCGLDGVASLQVMTMLRKLASEQRCTVIAAMQHSSSLVWALMDQLYLLSHGITIFFGPSQAALELFANAGFPCPRLQNPIDHFLGAINTNLNSIKHGQDEEHTGDCMWGDMDTSVVVRTVEATFQASSEAALVQSLVIELSSNEGPILGRKVPTGIMMCLVLLTWRSCVSMGREFGYYWLRLLLYMVLTLCIGTMYYNLGHSLNSIQGRTSALFVTVSFLSVLSVAGFPALLKEIKVVSEERSKGHTGVARYVLANLLASIPFILVLAIVCSATSYFLIGLKPAFTLFMYYMINIFLCLAIMDGLMLFIASVVPKVFEGILTTLSIQILMMLVSGYFRSAHDLPKPLWKYPAAYVSFHSYAIQGLLQNEYGGMEFPGNTPQSAPMSAQLTLEETFQVMEPMLGKWFNLLILAGMAAGYRVLLVISLVLLEWLKPGYYRSPRCCEDEDDD